MQPIGQTQVTHLDCYKLRLLQTHRFPIHRKFLAQNANWEEVLYEDSVKDLLKICLNHEGMD